MVLDRVKSLLDDDDVIYECRDCGTSLGDSAETCTECGSSEIRSFDV
jgi:rubrerythrin